MQVLCKPRHIGPVPDRFVEPPPQQSDPTRYGRRPFLETHFDPNNALSDGPNLIPLDELPALLDEVIRLRG